MANGDKERLFHIADAYKQVADILTEVAYGRDTVQTALKKVSPVNVPDVTTALMEAGYITLIKK